MTAFAGGAGQQGELTPPYRVTFFFDVDNTLPTAMIDRLMHHGEAITIEGKSYRTNDDSDAGC